MELLLEINIKVREDLNDLKLEGYDTILIGDSIEIPDLYELMTMQWVKKMDPEDVIKHGGEFNNYFLSKTPITNKRKHVVVDSCLYCLAPNSSNLHLDYWHTDNPDTIIHTFVGTGKHLTKKSPLLFAAESFEVDIDKFRYKHQMINWYEEYLDESKVKKCDLNRIISFNGNHIKKILPAEKFEFRFVWRVIESNDVIPDNYKDALKNRTRMLLNGNPNSVLSIEQIPRGIVLHGTKKEIN